MHGGYFSDPAVAQPLVAAVREVWAGERPSVVVDVGGGTGFLLSQLRETGAGDGGALVNLDGSRLQLSEAEKNGISCVRNSVEAFRRAEVVPAGRTALWLMRSVLHYAGEKGLAPLLRHLRAQAATGEFWVHQTACFEREEDADCLNALYRKMRTGKWYPAVADLRGRLDAAGWRVLVVRPAPALLLDSAELGRRYGLAEADLRRIADEMAAEFGGQNEVFRRGPAGFQADLHYRIFVCAAGA
ncbi:MAG: hypothetical protein EOM72_01245 [Opitutae bacterium]|nr:hypothetical protein [Opitutae bacterium]